MSSAHGAAAPASSAPLELPNRADSITELVGRTPLLDVTAMIAGLAPRVRLLAKLEGFNPGGSVKDRPALWMMRNGLASGALRPGKVVIDSTSGNTGIALAMIGAALGYPVTLVMPENVSRERKKIISAFGAEMVFSSGMDGSDGAILLCRQLLHADPERYFKPDQYFNPLNPQAHYESTGPEIWAATQGRVTHFVAGIGTGGTIMGTGRYLKEQNPAVQVIAAEPDDALHGLEGLKHMASSIVPGIYHETELDGKVPVPTDEAYELVYELGARCGLVVGQSSGAALYAAARVARGLDQGTVVMIFPDFGDRYMSTNLWAGWGEWQQQHRPA
ncbi:MAG: PLP-dependent cysteine synthase family protein [Candidatus Binatia bacterium]